MLIVWLYWKYYRAPVWISWVIQDIPIGYLFYICHCKFPCYSLHNVSPSLSSPPTMSIGLFSMSVSPLLSWKYIHQCHLFRFHICINIRYLYFSFWLTSLKSGIGRQISQRFRWEGTWVVYLWLILIECMYVCIYAWQKITKLCKAIILQLKKIKKTDREILTYIVLVRIKQILLQFVIAQSRSGIT